MAANGFLKCVVLGEKKLNSNQSSLATCIKGRKSSIRNSMTLYDRRHEDPSDDCAWH